MEEAGRDRPLTSSEKKKLILFFLAVPWLIYEPLIYVGAWFRSWPELPAIFVGLWLTPIATTISYVVSWLMLRDRPAIIRERLYKSEFTGGDKPQEPTKEHIAQRLLVVSMVLPFLMCGYESAERKINGEPDLPVIIYGIGVFLTILSHSLIGWVLRTNKYATKVVYKQKCHQLVKTGPYAYVRHPFYAFMILLVIGWPWMMGSFLWALIPSFMTVPILMWRTYHEEEFLLNEFGEDYERYQREVPYRMIPWVF